MEVRSSEPQLSSVGATQATGQRGNTGNLYDRVRKTCGSGWCAKRSGRCAERARDHDRDGATVTASERSEGTVAARRLARPSDAELARKLRVPLRTCLERTARSRARLGARSAWQETRRRAAQGPKDARYTLALRLAPVAEGLRSRGPSPPATTLRGAVAEARAKRARGAGRGAQPREAARAKPSLAQARPGRSAAR